MGIAVHVSEAEDQIKQIKNSDVNNGTEFYRLKNEIGDLVHERIEEVYENLSLTNETVNTTSVKLGALLAEHNKNLPDIEATENEVLELVKWKEEVNARLSKTENIKNDNADKKTESNPDLNIEDELDIEIENQDEPDIEIETEDEPDIDTNIEEEFNTNVFSAKE